MNQTNILLRLNARFVNRFLHCIRKFNILLVQVCFEEMSPPTKIFQCGNGGHLVCETCK